MKEELPPSPSLDGSLLYKPFYPQAHTVALQAWGGGRCARGGNTVTSWGVGPGARGGWHRQDGGSGPRESFWPSPHPLHTLQLRGKWF